MPSFSFIIKRAPSIGAGFDPLLTNVNLALTNDNRTATNTAVSVGYKQALCNVPKSSGKLYFEGIAGPFSVPNYSEVGIQNGSEALNVRLGSTINGWGYMDNSRLYNNNSYVSNGHGWSNGAIVNIAIDLDAGYIWCGVNGTWWGSTGQNPDPANGVDPLDTGISGTFYPAICIYDFGVDCIMSIALGSGSQTYSPPTGFTSWD